MRSNTLLGTRWRRTLVAVVASAVIASACTDPADGPSASGQVGSDATTGADGSGSPRSEPGPTDTSDGSGTGLSGGGDQPWDRVSLALAPVASMSEPTSLTARAGSADLWVTERVGRIRRIERTLDEATGTERLNLSTSVVLDLTDRVGTTGEGGLLGLAFSADGQRLYVHYTDRNTDNVVSEFPIESTTADPARERVLLRVEQPFTNHNGGDLQFGPDGLLYIAVGDGGGADDPLGNGQDPTTLLGTVLRIDPSETGDGSYTVPGDNPFATGNGGAPEVWMWGLRNPYRFSFDSATGDLWVADVGQNAFEEIDYLPADGSEPAGRGANLGWNLMEANERFAGPPPPDHVPPIHAYRHENGRCSVIGGYVYRGSFAPTLRGVYLFADHCSGEIFGLERTDGGVVVADLVLDREPARVISFGRGPDDEVYVLEQTGRISRLQPSDLPLDTTVSSG